MLAVICALTVLPTFADNQYTEKDIQKSVISMEMDDLSDEYLSQVEKLLYEQMHSQNYDSAINTIDYFINASKQYYGEKNSLTGFSYIAKERYYNGLMIPNMAKENLDKAYEHYLINKDNPDLRSNVLYDYVNYYSSIEEPYEAIIYANKALQSAEDKNQKIEVYNLLYKIYNDSGNKFKAYKYKKLGNIE